MCWNRQTLTVGSEAGIVSFFDTRKDKTFSKISLHNASVLGWKWNHDGNYLASSDHKGMVYVWDPSANSCCCTFVFDKYSSCRSDLNSVGRIIYYMHV